MPRPTTKQSLLEAAEKGFKELFGFAEAMSEEERCAEFLFEDRDRNIRDVFVLSLIHISLHLQRDD